MASLLARLRAALTKPLWKEDPAYTARRRVRTLFGIPFASLAGLVWGVYAAPSMVVGSGLFWGLVGAAAMGLFAYAEQTVLPPLVDALGRLWRGGPLTVLGAELAIVGGFVLFLTRVLDAPYVPGVEMALSFGAFYTVSMEYLLTGQAIDRLAWLVRGGGLGWGGSPGSRRQDHAPADTLLARGRIDEAADLYRRSIEERPSVASSYIRLTRVLQMRGDFAGAVETLEACLRRARMEPNQEGFVVRQIYDLCARHLHDVGRALEHVHLLLERQPEGEWAGWARAVLEAPADTHAEDEDPFAGLDALLPDDGAFELDTQRRLVVDEGFEVPPEQRVEGLVHLDDPWGIYAPAMDAGATLAPSGGRDEPADEPLEEDERAG